MRAKFLKACGIDWEYFDGIYKNLERVELQGHRIHKRFSHNGTTWFISLRSTLSASLIHDFLLKKGYDRSYCDKAFYEELKLHNNKILAGIYYGAVRTFSIIKGD